MKISEEIAILQQIKDEYGDINIEFHLENGTCYYAFRFDEHRIVKIIESKNTSTKELQLIFIKK